ncbi:hypothetical protein [Ignatzschineria indica]|uniref:hypothetical protein n=1 Tax=Ignatzschineria indica TaxID=472583 RepID=UPI001057D55D|nr:hypothetical protein [Ignatzschineria indica]
MPDITVTLFHKSRAGSGQSFDYQDIFSASRMPTCGHAVDVRARSFSPAVQQILLRFELLWVEIIKL